MAQQSENVSCTFTFCLTFACSCAPLEWVSVFSLSLFFHALLPFFLPLVFWLHTRMRQKIAHNKKTVAQNKLFFLSLAFLVQLPPQQNSVRSLSPWAHRFRWRCKRCCCFMTPDAANQFYQLCSSFSQHTQKQASKQMHHNQWLQLILFLKRR